MYFLLKNKYLENNLKINKYKKRKNIANYDGRKYEDYLKFKVENPNAITIEMDIVYNNKSGPYIQTFIFKKNVYVWIFKTRKKSLSMAKSLDELENTLVHDLYRKYFALILTNRSIKFQTHNLFHFLYSCLQSPL